MPNLNYFSNFYDDNKVIIVSNMFSVIKFPKLILKFIFIFFLY